MLDIELQRCTRRCAKTDREFGPGESIVSVLLRDGSQIKRLDYAAKEWHEPPPEAVAWWKSQMPGGRSKRALWAPHDVMLDYFQRLDGDAARADLRYVLALLMVRRRVLRLEQVEPREGGEEWLVLYCPRNELEYRVRVVLPTDPRVAEIQGELAQLLVTPAA